MGKILKYIRSAKKVKGLKCQVYRNLGNHTKETFSIRHKGRVIHHASFIIVKNAEFKINKSGQNRAKSTGQRNVHAFVEGEIDFIKSGEPDVDEHLSGFFTLMAPDYEEVYYNPFKYNSFVIKDTEQPVKGAEEVCLVGRRVFKK